MPDLTLRELEHLSAKELRKFLQEEVRKMFNQAPLKKHAVGATIDVSSFLEPATLRDRLKSPFSCLLSYFLSFARNLYRFSIKRKA